MNPFPPWKKQLFCLVLSLSGLAGLLALFRPRVPVRSGETVVAAARHARKHLQTHAAGTLCTVDAAYPGYAFGSLAYYASCTGRPDAAHPLLFLSALGRNARNSLDDPHRRATLAVHNGAGNLSRARLTLMGRLRPLAAPDAWTCFLQIHPDAAAWQNETGTGHAFAMYQLSVHHVYWIGGFGDQHYIGDIDLPTYAGAFSEGV